MVEVRSYWSPLTQHAKEQDVSGATGDVAVCSLHAWRILTAQSCVCSRTLVQAKFPPSLFITCTHMYTHTTTTTTNELSVVSVYGNSRLLHNPAFIPGGSNCYIVMAKILKRCLGKAHKIISVCREQWRWSVGEFSGGWLVGWLSASEDE